MLVQPELLAAIEEKGEIREIKAGDTLIEIGSNIRMMPLLIKGAIKILREDENGDELFIYFLHPGQSCAMTVQCCMNNSTSKVRAIAEDDSKLIAIPVSVIDEWMKEHAGWRNFVLSNYNDRFNELLETIDSVVFLKLDERLMKYLKERATIAGSNIIQTTHLDIAYDLHSSREVISRLLKQLERLNKIKLGRNKIELV